MIEEHTIDKDYWALNPSSGVMGKETVRECVADVSATNDGNSPQWEVNVSVSDRRQTYDLYNAPPQQPEPQQEGGV